MINFISMGADSNNFSFKNYILSSVLLGKYYVFSIYSYVHGRHEACALTIYFITMSEIKDVDMNKNIQFPILTNSNIYKIYYNKKKVFLKKKKKSNKYDIFMTTTEFNI